MGCWTGDTRMQNSQENHYKVKFNDDIQLEVGVSNTAKTQKSKM